MAETRTVGREIQDELLKAVRQSQEFVADAIKTWADVVRSITPKLPAVNLPFASQLPRPKDVLDNTYDFAQKLLANQRKFAEDVLKAAAPLAPGKSNGNTAPASTTGDAPKASTTKASTAKASTAKASTAKDGTAKDGTTKDAAKASATE